MNLKFKSKNPDSEYKFIEYRINRDIIESRIVFKDIFNCKPTGWASFEYQNYDKDQIIKYELSLGEGFILCKDIDKSLKIINDEIKRVKNVLSSV